MIQVEGLWHHYGVRPTLRGIDLKVEAGELMCVMGPNGMGKSTLLAVIAGIEPAVKGHAEIDGLRRRRSIEEEKQVRSRVVYLPDSPFLPKNNTGREFLLAVGRLYGVEEDRLFDHTQRLLDLFDLAKQADEPIRSYSTGQTKKIGLCSALVTDAPIYILDEPFSGGLDSSALNALQHLLKRMAARRDVTVLMAVPVPELVEGLADRIAVIQDGQIIACDSAEGLRRQTDTAGTLSDALERLIHPEGASNLARYFEGAAR
jgi:ABC-type multidrug transport system ATPase subunit